MRRRCIAVSLIAVLMTTQTGGSLRAQEPPGTATGRKIGTIVRTAIETALPGASALLGLIWGNRSSNDRINQEQLRQAVEAARPEIRDTLIAEAQRRLEPVSQIAEELRIVNYFLEAAVQANQNVITMQTRLGTTPSPTDDFWRSQTEDWDVAKNHLRRLEGVQESELELIRELWLRDQLRRIRSSNIDLVVRVDARLQAKDPAGLAQQLERLSDTLQGIQAAVGYQIADLRADLRNLAEWARGAQAAGEYVAPEAQVFRRILEE